MHKHDDVKIGVVVTPDEFEEDVSAVVTARGSVAIYLMVMIPIGLLAFALSRRNEWSTEFSIIFFSCALLAFTLIYVFSTLGVLTKILKSLFRFIINIYTVNRQHHAYLKYLEVDQQNRALDYSRQLMHVEPKALIEDKGSQSLESQVHAELLRYIMWLYQEQNGQYLHIQKDGRIKKAVPWSARQAKLDANIVGKIIQMVSWKHGHPIIYYDKNGWYLNIDSYPNAHDVTRMFNNIVVGNLMGENDEYRR